MTARRAPFTAALLYLLPFLAVLLLGCSAVGERVSAPRMAGSDAGSIHTPEGWQGEWTVVSAGGCHLEARTLVSQAVTVSRAAKAQAPATDGDRASCERPPNVPVYTALAHYADGPTAELDAAAFTAALEAARIQSPRLVASVDEMTQALIAAGMPQGDAGVLAEAMQRCESPLRDRDGQSIGIDLYAVGDGGLAVGAPQARRDVWGDLLRQHDVHTIDGAAAVAAAIREDSIENGHAALRPWSCVGGNR